MTQIYIISGFLGAGKTTLIENLLKNSFSGKKVALIENDFGEVSIDARLLKGNGYNVTELKAGCICCTITGDFIKALTTLITKENPDVIIIEPSGVGKLSDIEKACLSEKIRDISSIKAKITVVDCKRAELYYNNFGEFFENQVQSADAVVLSKTENSGAKLQKALEIAKKLNEKAIIINKDFSLVSADDFVLIKSEECHCHDDEHHHDEECHCHDHEHHHDEECHCHDHEHHHDEECHCHDHEHHHDEECHCHDHNHSANEAFDTLTFMFDKNVDLAKIEERINKISNSEYGNVVRAKGIVTCSDGYYNVQFTPGEILIEQTGVSGNEVCVIGKKLKTDRINELMQNVY